VYGEGEIGGVFLRDWCVFIYQERLGCMCVECMSVEGERGVFVVRREMCRGTDDYVCVEVLLCGCVCVYRDCDGVVCMC